MSKNIKKINEEKLRLFLQKAKKQNDIKSSNKSPRGISIKP